jgi:thioredoxin 1
MVRPSRHALCFFHEQGRHAPAHFQRANIMPLAATYLAEEPSRDEVNRLTGPVVLEFGTAWCGYCRALEPELAALLDRYPQVRHLRVEDGKGKPLGRSFKVKLWPTLVFLKDGEVIKQVSRPEPGEVEEGLQAISSGT